jgi:cobalt-precorrin 5A hydrolase/precorrin-3B C17-methyltransferase
MLTIDIYTLGDSYGWRRGSGDWQGVQTVFDRREAIQVIQEAGSTNWQTALPPHHPFYFGFPDFPPQPTDPPPPKARIWISSIQRTFAAKSDFPKVQWHPQVLWVGVGYQRHALTLLETAISQVCRSYHLAESAIVGIATLDHKAAEPDLIQLCQDRDWLLQSFSAEQLKQISVPTASAKVETTVGTASVSEAAALLAASASCLRVYKQVIHHPERSGAVTVAVAESEQEFHPITVEK